MWFFFYLKGVNMIDWKQIDELEWIGTEESIKESERLLQEYYNELAKKQQQNKENSIVKEKEPNLIGNDITSELQGESYEIKGLSREDSK